MKLSGGALRAAFGAFFGKLPIRWHKKPHRGIAVRFFMRFYARMAIAKPQKMMRETASTMVVMKGEATETTAHRSGV